MIAENHVKLFAGYFSDVIDTVEHLGGFHNHVYLIKGNKDFILRISSIQHRSFNDTIGEIDFLRYLNDGGASISHPLQGLDGKYVYEEEQDDCLWVVTAFSIAKGLDWRSRGNDENHRLIQIGKTIGSIHKLSRAYKPFDRLLRRYWNESQHLAKAYEIFRKYSPQLAEVYLKYLNIMKLLPRDDDCFGLVHGDFLFSNYNIHGNEVVVFDFDECEYSWFVYDIAVCMYYYLLGGDPSELPGKVEEAEEMLYFLLYGYLQEYTIDAYWIKNIDLFFKMREFVLLSTILEDESPDKMEGWQKSFFTGALDRQINNKPFVEADFSRIYTRLLQV